MEDNLIRTFIAIEFPAELKERIKSFQMRLKRPGQSYVKWVDPALMHITLKFMGNLTAGQVDNTESILAVSALSSEGFSLRTGQTGCFPQIKNIRIAWLGLEGDIGALNNLQKNIEESLIKAGFARDDRPFAAHITMARLRDDCTQGHRSQFAADFIATRFEPVFRFQVNRIALMRSRLTPRGPIYSRLAEYRFKTSLSG